MNLQNLVLRPNCLLTKSKLVFIPGPRSLFFYKQPFGQLPDFLYQHGYQIEELTTAFRNRDLRIRALRNKLEQNSEDTFHLIMDTVTFKDFALDLSNIQIKSVTLLTLEKPTDFSIEKLKLNFEKINYFPIRLKNSAPIGYLLHQIFCFFQFCKTPPFTLTLVDADKLIYDQFLDHCIELAENEVYA